MLVFLQLISVSCKYWPWFPTSLDPGGLGPFSPMPTSIRFSPGKPSHGPCSQRDGEGLPCPLETLFLAALLWLACITQKNCCIPTQLRAEMKIHIYLGHRLDLKDGLSLKREEIRNQASLTKYNRQNSFLNILSDLDCRSQGGNKKYLFCNPALL